MGEQHTLAKHALEPGRELDFRDGECMAKVQGAVHVRVREVSEPLGEPFLDLSGREALGLLGCRRVDLEDPLLRPSRLVLGLELLEGVALASLRVLVSSALVKRPRVLT